MSVLIRFLSFQAVSDALRASACTFFCLGCLLAVNIVGIMGEEHAASGFRFKYPVSSRFSLVMNRNYSIFPKKFIEKRAS